jgi:RNA polymerase sigma-70 factor (ECF subfamily)
MKDLKEKFTRLVRENKSTIYTVCYMFSQDYNEVSDLFQEVLIHIWKGIESFREDSKVSTWIYRVALNTCLLQERKKSREVEKVPLTMDINFFEDEDIRSLQVRQLHERINRLGLVDRAIVMMWLEDMSYDEIASVMGITPQNVGVKLLRIKEQLKKM